MKRFLLFICISFFILLLFSCSTHKVPPVSSTLTDINWQSRIPTNPEQWKMGSSRWFLLGEPNATEIANRRAESDIGAAMSTVQVNVGDFYNIVSNGGFQLQIFGSDQPSVYVYGPNAGAQGVSISQQGNTLYVIQTKNVSPDTMDRVIVRVGIRYLGNLTQLGSGTIEAIHIQSDGLCISASGSGKIYLAGQIILKEVKQAGKGCVFIFGANSRDLNIVTSGSGVLNISGNIGLRSIYHSGTGEINIIGARSDALYVYTVGSGTISICGKVNLCSLIAKNNTCVFIYEVRSTENTSVYVHDRAVVGLAGMARNLTVETCKMALFDGRFLCAQSAIARAMDMSHINVTAANRTFAAVSQYATIYFYGDAYVLEPFAHDRGRILPLEGLPSCRRYNVNIYKKVVDLSPKICKRHHRREIDRPGEG